MIILIQLAKWFWALFPALIGVIGGNVNQEHNYKLTNLVDNGDLLTAKPSPNENQPLGFNYWIATDISLTSGIAKFTGTQQYGRLSYAITTNINDKLYGFSRYKADNNLVRLELGASIVNHPGNNNFEYISMIQTATTQTVGIVVSDHRTSDWTPIEVDYIGAINLTAVFGAGNEPTKEFMDNIISTNGYFDTHYYFTDNDPNDNWFNNGFTGESREILDIIGYFFWLATPIIGIYWVFRLLLYII